MLLFVASAARADDSGGDVWLECFVGRGGFDSPEAVYERVAQAVASDAGEDLVLLLPGRCSALRAFDQLGPDALRHIGKLVLEGGWPEHVAAVRAFVLAEGGSLKAIATPSDADSGQEDEDWPAATVVSSTSSGNVTLHVTTFEIDGR